MLRRKAYVPLHPGGAGGEDDNSNEQGKTTTNGVLMPPERIISNSPSTQPRLIGFNVVKMNSATPSVVPTGTPSNPPTEMPTKKPSMKPTEVPTKRTSMKPSTQPSSTPTVSLSSTPTVGPTIIESTVPSVESTLSNNPTRSPTDELQSMKLKSLQILTLETTPYQETMNDAMIDIFEEATLQFIKDNIPSSLATTATRIDAAIIEEVDVKYQEYVIAAFGGAYSNPLMAPPPPGVFLPPNGPTNPGLRLEMHVIGEVIYTTTVGTTPATARSSPSNSSSWFSSSLKEVHDIFDNIAAHGFETNKTGLVSILQEESDYFRHARISSSVPGEKGSFPSSRDIKWSAILGGLGATAVIVVGVFLLYWRRRRPHYHHFRNVGEDQFRNEISEEM
mmetsp:Transcript_18628/g.28754  ORF Transcript_18628/g.28754 Transcript_18628/m.28754 type:complete len:391 (+) Transcript_18628:159-1331(+)|eukprot:CAMPEP_0195310152 /NCGR_PEP_ID=MMETSP0707-20130614/39101_1 /TAXON_ID=33640 /ORGANISM="Asterionellopsis glacialis, Strain CCMP134" /LENGTH=390 /DNA_ID=CAMNT_0040374463 /DNA_START=92 /DNA_END=1264 /DNA_ORIENTATION=+